MSSPIRRHELSRRDPATREARKIISTSLANHQVRLFVNDADALRQIENPEEGFEYYIYGRGGNLDGQTPKERMNERRREALDGESNISDPPLFTTTIESLLNGIRVLPP